MNAALIHRTRVCLGCPEKGPQPWGEFHAASKWPDGTMRWPQPRCKECDRKRLKAWRAANPNLVAAHKRTAEAKRLERIAGDPEYADEMRVYWREQMRRLRATPPERYRITDEPSGYVDTAPVVRAAEESGLTFTEISHRAGYTANATRHFLSRDRMHARTAARLLAAMGVAPVEVGM